MFLGQKWPEAVNNFELLSIKSPDHSIDRGFYFIAPTSFHMKYFIFFTLISLNSICTASQLEEIKIIGNDYTQNDIILREIQHPIPGEYDSTLAQGDRNRIYNLGLFSTVEIERVDFSYTVFLVETFRFFPFPIVDYNEAKGWSYGGGIAYLNFRGMNQKLTIGGIIGEETTYFIDFRDPWIAGDHVSLSGSVYQFHTKNPVYSYYYKERGFNIGTGFYKNQFHKIKIQTSFESAAIDTSEVNEKNRVKHGAIPLIYKYIKGEFTYRYDTRDIYLDPTAGALITLNLNPKFSFGETENYHLFQIKYLKYFQLSSDFLNPVLSLETRVLLQQSKSFPIFAYQYLGGEDFVRGYSPLPDKNAVEISHLIEGYNIFYHSVQLQHTLIKKNDYNRFKFGFEFGIDMVYFADIGIISDEFNAFKLNNTIVGFGFGFRIFASGAGVIGIDFGFNPYGQQFPHLSDGY